MEGPSAGEPVDQFRKSEGPAVRVLTPADLGQGDETARLTALMQEDIGKLWGAWHEDPRLVSKGVELLCRRDTSKGLSFDEMYTLDIAMKTYGFKPDSRAAKWVFSGLEGIAKNPSADKSMELELGLDILCAIKAQDRALIDGISLFDLSGQGHPPSRSLFRSLKNAPKLGYEADRHLRQSWTTSLLRLCFPDSKLQEELFRSLEESLRRRGSVNALTDQERADLMTLAVLKLEPQETDRFLDLLRGDLLQEQSSWKTDWIVDRARGRELRRGVDTIGKAFRESRLDELSRLLEVAQIDKSMMNREYWSERIIPEALPPQDRELRDRAAERFMAEFTGAYAAAGSIGKLPRRAIGALLILEGLSRDDSTLREKLMEALVGELRTDKTPNKDAAYEVCQRLRKGRIADNIGRIADPATKGEDRQTIIAETRDLLDQIHWKRDELARLLEETIKASSYVEKMSEALRHDRHDAPVQLIETEDDQWLVLDGLKLKVKKS